MLRGQSPMQADRGHVHHRLIDMGFSQKQSVMILYLISGILGVSAVVLTSNGALKALIFVIAVIAAIIIGSKIFSEKRKHNAAGKEDSKK